MPAILFYCPLVFDARRVGGEGAWVPAIISHEGSFSFAPKPPGRTSKPYAVGRGRVSDTVWQAIQADVNVYAVLDENTVRQRTTRDATEMARRNAVLAQCGHGAALSVGDSVEQEFDKLYADCQPGRIDDTRV